MANPVRPPRLLAVDLGSRRTGVAINDELGMFAHPRAAIAGEGNELVERIAALCLAESVDEVIVGLPRTLAGTDSEQTRWVREIATRLRRRLGIPVTLWDERLSTVQAARTHAGRTRDGTLDSRAAAVVLQAVLDARRMAATR